MRHGEAKPLRTISGMTPLLRKTRRLDHRIHLVIINMERLREDRALRHLRQASGILGELLLLFRGISPAKEAAAIVQAGRKRRRRADAKRHCSVSVVHALGSR